MVEARETIGRRGGGGDLSSDGGEGGYPIRPFREYGCVVSHGLMEVWRVGVGGEKEQGAEYEGVLIGGGRSDAESAWDNEGVREGIWGDGSSGIWRG